MSKIREQAEAIFAWGKTQPGYKIYWEQHSKSTARAAEAIARAMKKDQLDPDMAYAVGLLHDIGRVKMKHAGLKHPIFGYEILMEKGLEVPARISMTHTYYGFPTLNRDEFWEGMEEDTIRMTQEYMLRVKMYCETGQPEWRGLDAFGAVHHLPVAIQLEKFTIDEYPPKLMLIDKTGLPLPQGKPENLLIERDVKSGPLLDCKIEILKRIDNAIPVMLSKMIGKMPSGMMANIRMDSLGQARNKDGYIATTASGSACALLVKVTTGVYDKEGGYLRLRKVLHRSVTGWITSGSYLFPFQTLKLDDGRMLVMPNREPRRFASLVDIYTQSGKNVRTEIEVNKPFTIEGWKIYQLSYNEQMGKWSNLSVFELVTDPWLPSVYLGIFMLLFGSVGMFLTASRKKEVES